jgi:hypothetical protein
VARYVAERWPEMYGDAADELWQKLPSQSRKGPEPARKPPAAGTKVIHGIMTSVACSAKDQTMRIVIDGTSWTFRAVDANGEQSATFNIEVQIGDPNRAPTCDATSATVQAGHAVDVPLSCTDPDGNGITIDADPPAHGTLVGGRYTPAAGFSGQDAITFRATDEWGLTSDDAVATITVKPAPKPPVKTQPSPHPHTTPPPAPADKVAPSLTLLAPSSLASRSALRHGIAFTASTNEAGLLSVQVFVGRATARRYRIDRHATSRVLVGTLERELAKGDNAVKVKLFRKARKRLKKAPSVRLRMIARVADMAGNRRTERLRITLART